MNRLRKLLFPIVLITIFAFTSQIVGAEALKTWAPIGISILVMLMFAHFETRCDNISMDLEAVEDGLQKIDPEGIEYTNFRFRFPRK